MLVICKDYKQPFLAALKGCEAICGVVIEALVISFVFCKDNEAGLTSRPNIERSDIDNL